ncbi:MAG: hypothetical protein ACP5RT_01630 [Candidatus Micrarchaeia archaeon]
MHEHISAGQRARSLHTKLSKFQDGRINFSGSGIAPVITAYVFYDGKLLLLRRSDKVGHYKLMRDAVSGYLDKIKDPVEKVLEEVQEELKIRHEDIAKVAKSKKFPFLDNNDGVEWMIAPILIILSKSPNIKLDFENNEYAQVDPESISSHDTVAGLEIGLGDIIKLYDMAKK